MMYRLSDEHDRQRFNERVAGVLDNEKTVELTVKSHKRTLAQNAYFHLALSWFGLEFGYTRFEMKQIIKDLFDDLFVYTKNNIQFKRSTADLTKDEMTVLIDRFRAWSNDQCGLYIPSPDDRHFDQWIADAEYKTKNANQFLNK